MKREKLRILFYKYDQICETVSAREIGRVLGLDIDSHGRCRCPFHNGKDRNMVVYDNSNGHNGYNCFVCHANGNSIKFAQQILGEGYTYNDAARWIDVTFQLGILGNPTPTPRERRRRAELRAAQRRRQKE